LVLQALCQGILPWICPAIAAWLLSHCALGAQKNNFPMGWKKPGGLKPPRQRVKKHPGKIKKALQERL
jgi:hypothetical protein